jgi:DNA-binding MarR family transcriptional regulator
MKNYQLLKQLVDLLEEFEEKNLDQLNNNLENFSGFLNIKLSNYTKDIVPDVRFGKNEEAAKDLAYQLDNNIARLFIYMSRYAKSYIKKALDQTPLHTPEDFTCLAILLTHDSLLKTELIHKNLQEKTSGIEVINRLIFNGLVNQTDDTTDKRSKRIAITHKGKELLYKVFSDMNNVSKIVTGRLSLEEKLTLQYLLQKLENFHFEIYESKLINNKTELLAWK